MKQLKLAAAAVLMMSAFAPAAFAEGAGADARPLPAAEMMPRLPAASVSANGVAVPVAVQGKGQHGMASWYALPGRRTACGPVHNPEANTAAHRSLPCGTKVQVTNRNTGKSVVVTINDRGPFVGGRVIDLSRGPARVIGMLGSGTAPVQLAVVR